jgi:hypothetical protein
MAERKINVRGWTLIVTMCERRSVITSNMSQPSNGKARSVWILTREVKLWPGHPSGTPGDGQMLKNRGE